MKKKIEDNVNFNFHKNNYDIDSQENDPLFSNQIPTNDKKEDFITFQKKLKMDEKPDFNRISNLKDSGLPLEDKLQIQKQINDDDNDNDDQIEVLENILNNFGKEKNHNDNKFMMYKKGYKNKFKSNSVINHSNKILNKIKKDIALINFQQEINRIHKLHNYKIFLKSERTNLNTVKKNNMNKVMDNSFKNKKRIEEIKKKYYSNNKEKNNNNPYKDIKNFINSFNMNRKREKFFNSKNEKIFEQMLEEIDNFKENKNNNYNENKFPKTFRKGINNDYFNNISIINNNENQKQYNFPKNIIKQMGECSNENVDYLKTEESTKTPINNSNQFFFAVYTNSIKKYPYLHLLKNKINKMKNADLNQNKNKLQERNKKDERMSLLEKINSQRSIFEKEIEKYKIEKL